MKGHLILLFFPRVNTDSTRFMPYSVLHLERMLRDTGVEVMLIDEQVQPDYSALVRSVAPRLLAGALTAATGYQLKGAIAFSKVLKQEAPHAFTIWCGWHTSLMPALTLRESYVDFVISGQPERPFEQLVGALLNSNDYTTVKGLGYKDEGRIVINPKAPFENINNFVEINYELINPEAYIFENSFSKRCITYFASHGCPFSCDFCSLATVFGGHWFHKSVAQIIKDIKHLKQKARLDGISFWDDNFFTSRSFSIELAEAFIAEDINLKWECCTHAGLFNKKFSDADVALMHRAGLRQVFIGAESGDADILKQVHKNIEVSDNLSFVRKLQPYGISPVFLLIGGFPVNPDKDINATLNMVRQAKLLNRKLKIRLHIFVPVPGTPMFDVAVEKGLQMPDTLEAYVYFLYQFRPPWIQKDYRWQLEKFVNFYLPLSDPFLFMEAPSAGLKILTALLSLFFFPIARLRLHMNYYGIAPGAWLFLTALRYFNRITGRNLSLGTGSYLDKNNLGFYNSYCG